MDPIAAGGFVAALTLAMALVIYVRLRRRGEAAKLARAFWLMMVAISLANGVAVWGFASHHAAVAIGALAAVYVLPEFVLMPLRIRRSRAAARAARGARQKR
jgi:hypothetical protein